ILNYQMLPIAARLVDLLRLLIIHFPDDDDDIAARHRLDAASAFTAMNAGQLFPLYTCRLLTLLRARPPCIDHSQEIINVDDAVAAAWSDVSRAWTGRGRACSPAIDDRQEII